MFLFLFLILLPVLLFAILSMRRQSYRQHREMMRATNPELLAAMDAADRAKADKTVRMLIGILVFFGLFILLGLCQQFRGFGPDKSTPTKTDKQAAASPSGSEVIMKIYPPTGKPDQP